MFQLQVAMRKRKKEERNVACSPGRQKQPARSLERRGLPAKLMLHSFTVETRHHDINICNTVTVTVTH